MRTWFPPLVVSLAVGVTAGVACNDPTLPPDGGRSGGGAVAPSELPCGVARMLDENCVSCHASPPRGGAHVPLATRADLLAPAPSNPAITVAEDALERMRDLSSPMPPSGLLGDSASAPLEQWIRDGMPAGSCDDDRVPPADPYDTPLVCTSARFWTDGDEGDEEMHPGHACIACHADPDNDHEDDDDDDREEEEEDDLPRYVIAGTVYPSAHEPNDCYGVDSAGTHLVVEDVNGATRTLPLNAAGNFFTEDLLVPPYRVKIIRGGEARAMSADAEHGDCNLCHTADGAEEAPGRIMMP